MSNQDILVMDDSDSDTSIIDGDLQDFQTELDPEIINNEIQNQDEMENVQNEMDQQVSQQQYVEQLQIPALNIITKREQQMDADKVVLQNKKISRECDLKTMFKVLEDLNHDSKLKITNLLCKGSKVIHSQLIRSIQNLGNQTHYF